VHLEWECWIAEMGIAHQKLNLRWLSCSRTHSAWSQLTLARSNVAKHSKNRVDSTVLLTIPSMSLSHLVGALVRQKGMKGSDAQVWVYSNCCSSYCLPYFLLYNNLLFPFLTLSLEKIVGGHFQIEVSFLQGSAAYILREAHLHELLHLEILWIAHRELLNPVFGSFIELLALVLVHARYNSILGIVGLRCTEKSLERDQGSSNRKCWSPFIFQNV